MGSEPEESQEGSFQDNHGTIVAFSDRMGWRQRNKAAAAANGCMRGWHVLLRLDYE